MFALKPLSNKINHTFYGHLKPLSNKINNTFYGHLKEKIVFLHVPKCGGTSLDHAIHTRYPVFGRGPRDYMVSLNPPASSNVIKMLYQTDYPNDTKDDYPIFVLRENLLLYFMNQKKYKYITGHFTFSETAYREFKEEYAFMTILRDPIKRWLSSYFFNRYKTHSHRKIEEDITTHLESAFGQSQGYEYVKFIGGANPNGDYKSREAIDRAKNNLHNFDLVGLLEYQDDFLRRFSERFGITLKMGNKNQSPVSGGYRESIVTEEIRENIMKICEPDYEIYQYAVDKFVKTKTR